MSTSYQLNTMIKTDVEFMHQLWRLRTGMPGRFDYPEGNIPHATCVIGYPAESYHRIPVRKPVDVIWI